MLQLMMVFRAVQELLINVVKHSQAGTAKITVKRDEDRVRIAVGDDGVGFDSAGIDFGVAERAGFGLFSIRERLNHLGGHLEIDSRPGQGVKVTLVAPLQHGGETNEELT